MGWTDDARFLQMTRIRRNAAKEFQIIVLTCHPERFARLQPGRTIDLEKARRDAVEA
jgi:NAD(P)H-hydrate repair Nnr-like enzyme with NAD(P)H-hydrate dehydratase domain